MPRVAESRLPALPSSEGQKDRYRRILRAAAEHGAAHGLDGIQMVDVAKDAGVAVATMYRYFPSKTILFTQVLRGLVERLNDDVPALRPGADPIDAVADVLVGTGRELMRRPRLAHAMLHSNNATVAGDEPSLAVDSAFGDVILKAAGIAHPTDHDLRLVRLIEQTWYGVLTSALNGHIDAAGAEGDIRLACRLLLGDLGRGVAGD
ncbi:TetR/AcrR family transcriptional regulator [Nocardioides sp. GY 10113]|uniref:TetR family transcriptional regulator n=1 Tax=Nocardioides sp. GY 10113 TaxID=2569761 RepID=UPI0010A759EA|nr:TetR family transcriptional regulator [Nocardioides sp. GY 10113]TIC85115.1 TetR/AcrR family transcriptional regulator [Nocardioides sp. GY 10113]